MNEEVLNNDVTETESAVESTNTVTKEVEQPIKTYTQQEVDKLIQSERSKAKYDILKSMNVKSVEEFETLKTTYENSINESKELKVKFDESVKKVNGLTEDIAVMKLGVNDDFKSDFLTLVHSKVSDKVTFDDACKDVLERNPHWKNAETNVKIGVEKSEAKNDKYVSDTLLEKFPFLAK